MALDDFIASSKVDVLRCDVRRDDSSLFAFARRLTQTLESIAPGAANAFPTVQERAMSVDQPIRFISEWLREQLENATGTIVVDDLHHASREAVALLADLIERGGERLRFIVAARADLGFPIATWIGYRRADAPIGEDDLRFSVEETLAAAHESETDVDPSELRALHELTEGWPLALNIALRTRTGAEDLRSASSGARDMIYRYLAEQILSGLKQAQRDFVMRTCVFSTFDSGLAAELDATPDFLLELQQAVTFLTETAPGEFHYHDLFRDFLEALLRRRGETAWVETLRSGAVLVESRGDHAAAVALFTRARATDEILRIVRTCGFALFECGEAELLLSALDVLAAGQLRSDAAALGLNAALAAARGRFELAEHDFREAIDLATNSQLRLQLIHRYAIELVRHNRDCMPLLAPYVGDDTIPVSIRAPILGTLATGLVREHRNDEARHSIETALEILDGSADDEVRARLYQQAAHILLSTPDPGRAKTYALQAVELANRRNLYEVAARAYSVLYAISYDNDDPATALEMLEKLEKCARKGGSRQARVFGLIATYEIEVERANEPALERLDELLERASDTIESGDAMRAVRARALLPALALRASWNRDFLRAYSLIAPTLELPDTAQHRALRAAQASLYAFAAGLHSEAEAKQRDAVIALEQAAPDTHQAISARLFLTLAELIRGRFESAQRHLQRAEKGSSPQMTRLRGLAHAIRIFYRVALGSDAASEVDAAIEQLRTIHYAGFGRLLSALPLPERSQGIYAALTSSERQILRLLVQGGSTKSIAAKTSRSPQTVDTHIRSICRKLNCSGRREAVALAASAGWVA